MHTVRSMINDILRREGGFTDKPNDPAHKLRVSKGHKYDSYCTNRGITQYTLSNYWRRQATMSEVRALTEPQAKEIYQYEYFEKPKFNSLEPNLQPIMFDMGVNHGPKRAVKIMQGICVKAGYKIVVDGRIGFRSMVASEKCYKSLGGWMINAMVEDRIKFYKFLIRRNPSLVEFKRGWLRRANEFVVRGSGDHIATSIINIMERAV